MNKTEWWVSSNIGTCRVTTEDGIIKDTAAIWKKFKGQKMKNLIDWLSKYGNVKMQVLE